MASVTRTSRIARGDGDQAETAFGCGDQAAAAGVIGVLAQDLDPAGHEIRATRLRRGGTQFAQRRRTPREETRLWLPPTRR